MLADMSLPDDSNLDEIKTADAASPRQSASERDALCHPKRESRTGAGYYKPLRRTPGHAQPDDGVFTARSSRMVSGQRTIRAGKARFCRAGPIARRACAINEAKRSGPMVKATESRLRGFDSRASDRARPNGPHLADALLCGVGRTRLGGCRKRLLVDFGVPYLGCDEFWTA